MAATKLTILVPDDLRRRAKSIAALRDENLSDIVRRALEEYIAEAMEEAEDLRVIEEMEERIARGQVRVREWADVEADLNALQD